MDFNTWKHTAKKILSEKNRLEPNDYLRQIEAAVSMLVYGKSFLELNFDIEVPPTKLEQAKEAALKISAVLDCSEEALLRLGLEECERLTDSQISFLHFVNPDQKSIDLQMWSQATMLHCEVPNLAKHYPVSKAGVWVDCIKEGKAIIYNDYQALPHKKGMPKGHHPVTRMLVVPVFENGKIVTILGVGNKKTDYNSTDTELISIITETLWNTVRRKRAENALVASEKRYRLTFLHAPFFLYLISPDGKIRMVNETAAKVVGSTTEHIENSPASDWLTTEQVALMRYRAKQCLNDPQIPKVYENKFFVNGKFLWLSTITLPFENKDVLFISRDITAQKLSEHMLRESESELKAIAENIPDILIRFDEAGNNLYANSNCKKILGNGISTNRVDNFAINHPDFAKKLEQNIANVFETQKSIDFTAALQLEDREAFIEWRLVPELTEAGLIESVLVIGRDFSSQHIAEQELIFAKEKAEESDQLKSAFLANMSHEIRTPMNAIVGFAQMLDDDELDDERKEFYVDQINEHSHQLLQLINDIIDLSKIESGQIELKVESINLNSELREMHRYFERVLHSLNENVELILDLAVSDDEANLRLDITRFRQIMTSLVDNAIKFTQKGEIVFGYKVQTNSELLFYVKDTGIGISQSAQDVIFERFRQAQVSFLSKEYAGTGLGLAITKSLVELFGGEIWLESELGLGSIFYFTYTYVEGGAVENVKPASFPNPNKTYNWADKTVLIVEDSEINLYFLKELLRITKIDQILTKTGKDALDACARNPEIDIVLIDIQLPDLNGYEVTQQLKRKFPHLPIIAQTAFAMQGDEQLAIDAGCDNYISKPIVRADLLEKMSVFLQ